MTNDIIIFGLLLVSIDLFENNEIQEKNKKSRTIKRIKKTKNILSIERIRKNEE